MRTDKNYWLYTTPIAHRGLWGNGIVENSMEAYKNAVDNGFPIELDLYKTTDGEIVSFHDDTLKRMTGEEGFIFDKTLKKLKSLNLVGSTESIPTFKEILALVDGKVPLLIELKNQPDGTVVDSVIEILKDYKGEYAIQSFNPKYMIKVKKLAPDVIRGVLGSPKEDNISAFKQFIIKRLPLNFLVKPDFISYHYNGLKKIKHKAKNKGLITWTVTSREIENNARKYAENIIFENYLPTKKD